jgi:hypothetical protein
VTVEADARTGGFRDSIDKASTALDNKNLAPHLPPVRPA